MAIVPNLAGVNYNSPVTDSHLRTTDVEENLKVKGNVDVAALPTSDPHVVGRMWNNSGVVTVSNG